MVDVIGDLSSQYALIVGGGNRSIGMIIPDVTIEEVHHDELVITDHPVEVGATISDHAFKRPVEVQMRVGWSDSSHQSVGFVRSVYEELVALQMQREPFDVSTGKRQYKNMLLRSIAVTTDVHSEFALSCVAGLREVIITNTQSTSSGTQANPQQTSPTANTGTQQVGSAQDVAGAAFGTAAANPGADLTK